MQKTLTALIAPVLVAGLPLNAYAQTSVSCMYMLMRVYHAELDACHVPLQVPREQRYQRMKAGLEQFIRKNARQNPQLIIDGIQDNIKRALAGLKSCNSDDFRAAVQAMDQITTEDHEKMVQGTLSYPRDPQVGDCSS
jgi:hypothetical protein